jgi:hypothetical protein
VRGGVVVAADQAERRVVDEPPVDGGLDVETEEALEVEDPVRPGHGRTGAVVGDETGQAVAAVESQHEHQLAEPPAHPGAQRGWRERGRCHDASLPLVHGPRIAVTTPIAPPGIP